MPSQKWRKPGKQGGGCIMKNERPSLLLLLDEKYAL
jgi:hypothetical protein